jgi:hypothetical protein
LALFLAARFLGEGGVGSSACTSALAAAFFAAFFTAFLAAFFAVRLPLGDDLDSSGAMGNSVGVEAPACKVECSVIERCDTKGMS